MTNREFSKQNEEFREACISVGLPIAQRQAQKWRNKKGKAYKTVKIGELK